MYKTFAKEITKAEVNALPVEKFAGKIVLITQKEQVAEAVAAISQHKVVGFDTETKPTFRKGEYNNISLLQVATTDVVYLFRLNLIGFPKALSSLFEDPSVLKVGISIRDDIKELLKLDNFNPQGVTELNTIAASLGIKHAGVRSLAAIFLEIRVSKTQQTTNWERATLSEQQLRYAATDAWVCLEIYNTLNTWGYL